MKPINLFVAVLCLSILKGVAFAKPARTLSLGDADVGEVHTAIGYSTILQFESRPMSVVIGDQDSFKVEYVGNSLTLKPTIPGGRTNMFVFTGYDRYSFKVSTGRSDGVDYFVEVKRKSAAKDPHFMGIEVAESNSPEFPIEYGGSPASKMVVQDIGRKIACSGLQMKLISISYPKGKQWLVIALSLSNLSGNGEPVEFQGQDVFLTQGTRTIPFETLYLESLKLPEDGRPVHGSLLLSAKSSKTLNGLVLNFRPAILAHSRCHSLKLAVKLLSPNKKPEEIKGERPNGGKANENKNG